MFGLWNVSAVVDFSPPKIADNRHTRFADFVSLNSFLFFLNMLVFLCCYRTNNCRVYRSSTI